MWHWAGAVHCPAKAPSLDANQMHGMLPDAKASRGRWAESFCTSAGFNHLVGRALPHVQVLLKDDGCANLKDLQCRRCSFAAVVQECVCAGMCAQHCLCRIFRRPDGMQLQATAVLLLPDLAFVCHAVSPSTNRPPLKPARGTIEPFGGLWGWQSSLVCCVSLFATSNEGLTHAALPKAPAPAVQSKLWCCLQPQHQ